MSDTITPVKCVPDTAETKVSRIGVKTADTMTIPMPASLDEVLEIVGEAVTLQLVNAFGGTTQRLPAKRNVVDSNEIAQVIGLENLRLLVEKLGGGRYLYIPRCADGMRLQRDRKIVELSRTVSVDALARRYQLSDRQIWTILKKTPVDDGQEQLF